LILGEKGIVIKEQSTILGVVSYEKDSGSVLEGLINMVRFDFIREMITLKRMISPESFAFFNRYMRFTTSVRPKAPHYYLVFIGIAPEAQGRGLGRAIIEEIHTHVDADTKSVGIGLDTENEANVAYYETFGYNLIEQRTIDDVTVYAMFRTKR
jgi:ribosomal protein S18 acetylase RimI-like enzyme